VKLKIIKTCKLTPRSSVLLEKLIVTQLDKKFPAFRGTLKFLPKQTVTKRHRMKTNNTKTSEQITTVKWSWTSKEKLKESITLKVF
jgi:hypothetical protein